MNSTIKSMSNLFSFLLFSFLLLHKTSSSSTPHTILLSSCSSARHPDLCFSSIAASPSLITAISAPKDVIHASLNLTRSAIRLSFSQAKNLSLSLSPTLTHRERTAIHDCLEMFAESLDELDRVDEDLKSKSSVSNHAEDLKILLSGAMANLESCVDGFSHDEVDRRLRGAVIGGIDHVTRMCANSLAMIKNMTDGADDVAGGPGFAMTWVAAAEEDRRRVEEADVVVAADGSGDFRTVAEAVEAAPAKSKKRYVIGIKEGRYEENVEVGKKKTNIMFVGAGRGKTVITGSRNVVDGFTTFKSATLAVAGGGFLARDLTIENSAGPSKHQAVALRVNADLTAFYDCDILGYQDTLYAHSLRQFYRNCLIQGTVDFIFGNAAVVLQDCDIQARRPNPGQKNMVTAPGRTDPDQPTAISLHRCRIGAVPGLNASLNPTYLGRPWKEYSRTVIMESEISEAIQPAGWHEWNGEFALDTLYYGEYQNTGAGAGIGERVKWKGHRVIESSSEAQQFTPGEFITGSQWLGSTGFPFALGL